MESIRNHWWSFIEAKKKLEEAEKRLYKNINKGFCPPIYKKLGDPNHPLYGTNTKNTKP